jgi:hypothetical protein
MQKTTVKWNDGETKELDGDERAGDVTAHFEALVEYMGKGGVDTKKVSIRYTSNPLLSHNVWNVQTTDAGPHGLSHDSVWHGLCIQVCTRTFRLKRVFPSDALSP